MSDHRIESRHGFVGQRRVDSRFDGRTSRRRIFEISDGPRRGSMALPPIGFRHASRPRPSASARGLVLLSAGHAATRSGAILLRDGHREHPHPNSGRPEAAMASAFSERLGGGNLYGRRRAERPVLGVPRYPCESGTRIVPNASMTPAPSDGHLGDDEGALMVSHPPMHGGNVHAAARELRRPIGSILDFSASINPSRGSPGLVDAARLPQPYPDPRLPQFSSSVSNVDGTSRRTFSTF